MDPVFVRNRSWHFQPEKDRPNGPVELQKYVVMVKDRNFLPLMDKSQILEEEEWTGMKEFQLKVGTHENNFVDYLRNNEKPSILLAVHLVGYYCIWADLIK